MNKIIIIGALVLMITMVVIYSANIWPTVGVVPKNWCEGLAQNNKHIEVITCSCDKDKCYVVVDKKRN